MAKKGAAYAGANDTLGATQQIVGREPRERVSHEAFVNQSWRSRAAASTRRSAASPLHQWLDTRDIYSP
jgi:hypothetical protein